MLSSICVFIVFTATTIFGAIESDLVTSLPGYNGSLPSNQYSGYLTVPNTNPARHYHYWFIESENNPSTDPFIVFFNGGPGASSLMGYFTENGPFHTNAYSLQLNTTQIPLLFRHNYTWSSIGNVLYIESPADIGFSYCDNFNCPHWNDTLTSSDNYQILKQFFHYYKEYLNNSFYLTGESYAGVYIPTLVMQIESHANQDKKNNSFPKLSGFAIGDGCLGTQSKGGCGKDTGALFVQTMYGHGQLSKDLYNKIWDKCYIELENGNWTQKPECDVLAADVFDKLGGFNLFDIYDTCDYTPLPIPITKSIAKSISISQSFKEFKDLRDSSSSGSGYDNPYVCGGMTALSAYLNQQSVKKAIHVNEDIKWSYYDSAWVNLFPNYTQTTSDLTPYYKEWVLKYRILVYYGDVDAAVPTLGGEQWTSQLGYDILEKWRPWTIDGKSMMAGYVQTYDTQGTNFTFLTIRGAGHQVPQFRPKQSLKMIQTFLNNQQYPYYKDTPVGRLGGV